MKKHLPKVTLAIIALCSLILRTEPLQKRIFFPNPSFEEDMGNLGWPDHWKREPETRGQTVENPVSHGNRSLKFTEGYCLLTQNFDIKHLANSTITITCDLLSPDGAQFGLITGSLQKNKKDGKTTWINDNRCWDIALEKTWRRDTISFKVSPNAQDGRFYVGFYRSNGKGTLYIDNLSINVIPGNTRLSPQGIVELNRIYRDLDYLKNSLQAPLPALADFEASLKKHATADDATLKAFSSKGQLLRLKAAALRQVTKETIPLSWTDYPCQRQDLGKSFPKAPHKTHSLTALRGEWQALGLDIANPSDQPRTVTVVIQGLEAFDRPQVRRVVATENWYTKEQDLMPDPLVLLKDSKLTLEPGEHTRLHIAFKTRKEGTYTLRFRDLTATVTVLPLDLPQTEFANYQFLWTSEPIFTKDFMPHVTKDMQEHYVTDVEFPDRPQMVYKPDGTPTYQNMENTPAQWRFHHFAEAGIRCILFWTGGMEHYTCSREEDGITFATPKPGGPTNEPHQVTEPWKKSFCAMVTTFMDYARKQNLHDYVSIMAWDEIHSGKHTPPSPLLDCIRQVMEAIRAAEPRLSISVTCGIWTRPEDIFHVLHVGDCFVLHWPQPDLINGVRLHERYVREVVPRLKAEQRSRPMKIWSYRVVGGRSTNPDSERAYPLAMAGWGVTGVGTWAYFVSSGKSWDDTDGHILDYCYVYNGKEDHPLCRKYNVTGEPIVPSLRWEALRLGIQDAKILLALKPTPEVRKLLGECEEIAVTKQWDIQRILEISREVRRIYARQQGLP